MRWNEGLGNETVTVTAYVMQHPIRALEPPFRIPSPVIASKSIHEYTGMLTTSRSVTRIDGEVFPQDIFVLDIQPITGNGGKWQLKVRSKSPLPTGPLRVAVRLTPVIDDSLVQQGITAPPPPPINYQCDMTVQEHVIISPEFVSLGGVPLDQPFNVILQVSKRQGAKLELAAITCASPDISVRGAMTGETVHLVVTPALPRNGRIDVELSLLCDGIPVVRQVPIVFRTTRAQ